MKRKAKRIEYADYPMTATGLRTLGIEWLRYVRGCYVISCERSPWTTPGLTNKQAWSQKPDVLGLTGRRQTIEIEIKISKADFLHDEKKAHRKSLGNVLTRYVAHPNYLYYLVPRKLVPVVLQNAPHFAGILSPSETAWDSVSGMPELDIVRRATRIHTHRLNLHDTVVMARDMAGTMASMARDAVKHTVTKRKLLEVLDEMEAEFLEYKRTHTKRTVAVEDNEKVRGTAINRAKQLKPKKRNT